MQQSTEQTSWLGLFKESQHYYRQMKPQLERLGAHAEHRRIALWCSRFEMKCLAGAIHEFMAKSGYNPNQPRVPAGNADGGEWTSGGGGAGAVLNDAASRYRAGGNPAKPYAVVASNNPHVPALSSTNQIPPVPAYKKWFVQKEDWKRFHNQLNDPSAMPGLTDAERYAYPQVFAAEGGMGKSSDPKVTAIAGINKPYLKQLEQDAAFKPAAAELWQKLGGDSGLRPDKLTPEDVVLIYRYDFDERLKKAGGSAALDQIGNPYAAATMADTLFRHGAGAGGNIIRTAIIYTDAAYGETLKGGSWRYQEKDARSVLLTCQKP